MRRHVIAAICWLLQVIVVAMMVVMALALTLTLAEVQAFAETLAFLVVLVLKRNCASIEALHIFALPTA